MGMAEIVQGKAWKNFMAKLYGWGAAVVIVGALFKIQHWPGAGPMLVLGLGTEAVIFFFSAFEPPHEEVDWSLVYPELAGMHDEDHGKKKEKKGTATQELDKMLEQAKIGPELLESVGSGLQKLGESTSKLADITDASAATNEYVKNVKDASRSVGDLSLSYSKATEVMNELSSTSGDVKNYHEQVSAASQNLSAINAVYEMQLKDADKHLKETSKLYDGIAELMQNLNASLDDTKRYKDEVSALAKNLSALNTIYGNMLSAMSTR